MKNSRAVKSPCNDNLLKELDVVDEPINTTAFQQAIGSLNYLAQHTHPDILFTVNSLSRYATHPTDKHWVALKHLLRLVRWADADYANDRSDRKSVSGNLKAYHGQEVTKPAVCNDNLGAVTISNQASLNPNTKHIEIRYQYVRDMVIKNLIELRQVGTSDMMADVLTKPMGIKKMKVVFKPLHLKNQGGVLESKG
ncbi:hypothetical protein O181_013504 [Austropuccinia psidii MF-1]|uniref:Reverse transcriptase Ty1/copia-type domain-containing protein n=1 Tax=Austropuccinia psidii MF-1 TaxID=1389203 RepID=A0A9Q3BWI8_9BASI|nr:hypothetical protein [Austropuccinia psidii MF-1]